MQVVAIVAQVVLASMPLLPRPAACLRRPAAAALASPALPLSPDAPPAFDVPRLPLPMPESFIGTLRRQHVKRP